MIVPVPRQVGQVCCIAKNPELKNHIGKSLADALHDPQVSLECICSIDENSKDYSAELLESAELEIRYEHYIAVQNRKIAKVKRMENTKIPADFDYDAVSGLSTESRTRLKEVRPETIGQASRIRGIRPSDIMLLSILL